MKARCAIPLSLLFLLSCAARSAWAYECSKPSAEWAATVETYDRLQAAKLIDNADKQPLLSRFAGMKQVSDSIQDGSHPICQAWAKYADDVGQYNQDLNAHNQEVNAFNSECATPPDTDTLQLCQARMQPLLTRKQDLDERMAELNSRLADLTQQTKTLNDENQQRWKDFTEEVDRLLTTLPEAAGSLVSAMDSAAHEVDPGSPPNLSPANAELNCKHFFQTVGRGLSGTDSPEWSDTSLSANQIGHGIAVSSREWQDVSRESEIELQKRANQGEVIVGVYENSSGHGHLAVVMPVPPGLDFADFPGSGPFVRDGNVHHTRQSASHPRQIAPLGRGAARASYAFSGAHQWYVWIPSEQ